MRPSAVRTGLAAWAVRELRRRCSVRRRRRRPPRSPSAADSASERTRAGRCRARSIEAFRGEGHAPRPAQLHPDCVLLDGGDPTAGFPASGKGGSPSRTRRRRSSWAPSTRGRASASLDVCAAPGGKARACGRDRGRLGARRRRRSPATARRRSIRRAAGRLGARPVARGAGRDAPGARGDVRSGARRRPVLRDRVGASAAGAALAAAPERPHAASRGSRSASLGGRRPGSGPGGRLVYSVCTFPRAETDAACDALLRLSHRSGARATSGSGRARRADPSVAAPAWLGRHVRGGLQQSPSSRR